MDPQLPLVALQRAVELLTSTPAVRSTPGSGTSTPPPGRDHHRRRPPRADRRGGLLTAAGDRAADRAGATVESLADGRLRVTPPDWRPDLTDQADLVEEVARLDGYDRIPSVLPTAPRGGAHPLQRRRRTVGRALAEAGYVEARCYPFVGKGTGRRCSCRTTTRVDRWCGWTIPCRRSSRRCGPPCCRRCWPRCAVTWRGCRAAPGTWRCTSWAWSSTPVAVRGTPRRGCRWRTAPATRSWPRRTSSCRSSRGTPRR